MTRALRHLPALLLVATACSNIGVIPEGPGSIRPARPADCAVEFVRGRKPDRPYDKVAVIMWESVWHGELAAFEDIRRSACAVGADAVLVNREYVYYPGNPGQVIATAIKYRAAPAPPPAPAPAPAAP